MDTKVRTRDSKKKKKELRGGARLGATAKKVLIESLSHTVSWPRSVEEIKQED